MLTLSVRPCMSASSPSSSSSPEPGAGGGGTRLSRVRLTKRRLSAPGCLPSLEICFQGLGGYMKAALWIWSLISSSSLKGNVPLRLTYMMTPTDHMSSERL
ncbi:hypothetical protein EYF80_044114 [Liparis tanakae]|uniref:Uncharacterized protein n=1 Tax=Liparis tanakae TaxID=230148 RepID=A0A4Z2FXS5_9TELE|nr:hypothetical protein EYF80_044114 [Liparis tanakae]